MRGFGAGTSPFHDGDWERYRQARVIARRSVAPRQTEFGAAALSRPADILVACRSSPLDKRLRLARSVRAVCA